MKSTPGYKIEFEILDGDYRGRKLWHDCWLTPAALPQTVTGREDTPDAGTRIRRARAEPYVARDTAAHGDVGVPRPCGSGDRDGYKPVRGDDSDHVRDRRHLHRDRDADGDRG